MCAINIFTMFFLLILMLSSRVYGQFIFDSNEGECSFAFEDQQLKMPGSLMNFTHYGQQFLISPCKSLNSNVGCRRNSRICVKQKGKKINAGTDFQLITDDDDTLVLKSTNGDICQDSTRYTTFIHFECSPDTKTSPTVISVMDCEFHIRAMHPSCNDIKCTKLVDGHLIDLQQFKNKDIEFKAGNKTYYVSLCGKAKTCRNAGMAACEAVEGGFNSIGDLTTQRVHYDSISKQLLVRMHFGAKQSDRITTEVLIKCNWKSLAANPKVTNNISAKRHFEMESTAACIKLPMNCVVTDNNLIYNLTSLYRPNNLSVGGTTGVLLNMCGRLNVQNKCADTYSQVCKDSLNYGSILSTLKAAPLKVTEDNRIIATFSDGETCPHNSSFSLSTDISFRCSFKEGGPILKSIDSCTLNLDWETPQACPVQMITKPNCYMVDQMGHRDLSQVHSNHDQIHQIAPNSYLRYNLCGPLIKPCDKSENASACLTIDNKEIVMGNATKTIKSVNGMLSLTIMGDRCENYPNNKTLEVNFFCNYASRKTGDDIYMQVLQDNCYFQLNFSTPLACGSLKETTCKVSNKGVQYDLTPLSSLESNYIIKDEEENLEYILNICRPVLTTPTSLCSMDSAACLRNISEPNSAFKFSSLGLLRSPEIIENELVVRYTHGKFCRTRTTINDLETLIKFNCANEIGYPTLLEKKDCKYVFQWNTKFACGLVRSAPRVKKNVSCILEDSTTRDIYDLGDAEGKKITFKDKHGRKINFDICSKTQYFYDNDTHQKLESQLNITKSKDGLNLIYKLHNNCINYTNPNLINVSVTCGEYDKVDYLGTNVCTTLLSLKTNAACSINTKLDDNSKPLLSRNNSYLQPPVRLLDYTLKSEIKKNVDIVDAPMVKKNEDIVDAPLKVEKQKDTDPASSSREAIIIGSTSGSIIILITIMGLFLYRKQSCKRKLYEMIHDKQRTPIYQRDTEL